MEADKILKEISQASLQLLSPHTLEEVYKIIVDEAIQLVHCDDGFIVRDLDQRLQTVYGSSASASKYIVKKNGNTYKVLKDQKAVIVHSDGFGTDKSHVVEEYHSVIYVPLSYKGISEGVLVLRSSREKHFTSKQLHILNVFGSMASLAIKKNELHEQTRQAVEVRDMFISIASHELRTPLTSLNGYVQLLHTRLSKKGGVEGKWIQSLSEETDRLTLLITELLEINRIKQGTLNFILRECHLSDVIKTTVERYGILNKNRKIEVINTVGKQDVIIADFDKMLQVISSLVGNAIKFSPVKSVVTISLTKKAKNFILEIRDTGRGMGREDIRRVFQGFYKDPENLQSGMGVGLMMAKHIVTYHKGTIEVGSEKQQGTTIKIQLPIGE